MPISSGASGRRSGLGSASASTARSTPNLAAMSQQQQQQQQQPGRMIDAPPKVESRRQMGSQTLYGSRPPWATDDDASSPQPQQQPQQQPQPPFYPAGSDLPHGEAARMRRLKAARQIYKSPQTRHRHTTTGSVDDLLRDCAISDHSHSHSPSPVRRTPSAASSLAARSTSDLPAARSGRQPGTRNVSVGTDTLDSHLRSSEPNLLRGGSRRSRRNRRSENDNGSVSDDSLDDGGEGRIAAAAAGTQRGSVRGRRRARTSRGTSPPPTPPLPRPLYVDTGCDPEPQDTHLRGGGGNGFGRTKLAPGLKPASERRYVPPPPLPQPTQSQLLSMPVMKHDCLPIDHPPFRARPMPDFSGGASPAPIRQPRSRSQSPAAVAPWRVPNKTPEVAGLSSTTSGYRSGGSGGGSPQRQQQLQGRQRRRSMDEDSLTEASSAGGREDFRARPAMSSVSTEVLHPQRAPAAPHKRADAVDSALRNLDQQPAPPNAVLVGHVESRPTGTSQTQQLARRRQAGGDGGGGSGSISGRSSILLVPEKVLKDRSMTDIDLDEIFGTESHQHQPQHLHHLKHQQRQHQRKQPQLSPQPPEVNERIQYWLKRNIYFHASDQQSDTDSQPQQHPARYGSSPPSSETLRTMKEHRPAQPRMEILVQRTEVAVQQLAQGSGRHQPRHVSTVEYPVRKFQQLPNGYLSPSSSEGDIGRQFAAAPVSAATPTAASQKPAAEIIRQAVIYARSTGADPNAGDSAFWYSAENGSPRRSPATAFNNANASSSPRPASTASQSPVGNQGRVRALASRFGQQQPQQQQQQQRPDYLSSYQRPQSPGAPHGKGVATPDLVRSTHLQEVYGRPTSAAPPVVSAQLRRASPPQQMHPSAGEAATSADSKTFYFGDRSLVSKREQREHWASGYFNRPKIEIIERGGNSAGY